MKNACSNPPTRHRGDLGALHKAVARHASEYQDVSKELAEIRRELLETGSQLQRLLHQIGKHAASAPVSVFGVHRQRHRGIRPLPLRKGAPAEEKVQDGD